VLFRRRKIIGAYGLLNEGAPLRSELPRLEVVNARVFFPPRPHARRLSEAKQSGPGGLDTTFSESERTGDLVESSFRQADGRWKP
jgi:hypothetical protein